MHGFARLTLIFLAAFHISANLAIVAAQSLNERVTIVEQQLRSYVLNVGDPMTVRLTNLERDVRERDLMIESRLVSLEKTVNTFGQLLLAVGAGVLVQLISAGVRIVREVRAAAPPPSHPDRN